MEYLHINFMVNETYMDLLPARALPDAYRDTVRRYAVNEDCMRENAPSILTFFTTRGEDEKAITFFARTQRHTTTVSVGRFSQAFGWEWGQNGPSEKFTAILDSDFYTEAELNPLAASNAAIQFPEKKRAALPEVTLAPQAKKAVLTAAMLRWLRSDPAIRIAVPRGVDYDSYVIAAMKQIYGLFPLGLQAVAGFCSYMPDTEKAIPQVYFGFIPQDMADTKTLFLDDSSQSALAVYADGTRRDGLDRLINYICSCSDADLQEFLNELYTDVEGCGNPSKVFSLGTRNYQAIGDALRIMSIQGTPQEHLKEWQNFYDNINRYSDNMRLRIKKHIAATVDPEAIVALYIKGLQGETDALTVFRALRSYNTLCGDCPALAEALWNTAVSHLLDAAVAARKIREAAENLSNTLSNLATPQRLDGLYLLTLQTRLQKLLAETPQDSGAVDLLTKNLEDLEKDLLDKKPEGYLELLNSLQAKKASIQSLQGDMQFQSICKQLVELEQKPVENLTQIQDVGTRAKILLQRLDSLPRDSRVIQLGDRIRTFQQHLNTLERSSFTDLNEILRSIEAAGNNYFAALNNVELSRLRKLDTNQHKQVMDALDAKRPPYMGVYVTEYEKSGQKLCIASLMTKNEFVLSRIIGDLGRFNYMTIPFDPKLDDKLWENRLNRAKLLARELFGQEKGQEVIAVTLDNMDYEYTFFQDLRTKRLKPDSVTDANQQQALSNATMSLIALEIFRDARDLDYLTRLFAACQMSFQKLFLCIMAGAFGTDPRGNTNAFEQIVKTASKQRGQTEEESVQAMLTLVEENRDLNSKVVQQFQTFAEKIVGKGAPKRGLFNH